MGCVLGTAVEASPNENRRQSSQCFRKDVGGFRLIVAGRTKPFDPTRHQLPGKIGSYGWIRGRIFRREKGSKLPVFGWTYLDVQSRQLGLSRSSVQLICDQVGS